MNIINEFSSITKLKDFYKKKIFIYLKNCLDLHNAYCMHRYLYE